MVGTLRRAAKHADLVHANWLAAALVARFSGKPFVISLHGTPTAGRFSDLQLAHKYPGLVRFLLAPARLIISPSEPLAEAVRACGLDNVRVIPYGIEIPETVTEPDEPPFALYAGRLSHEKGIDVIAQATAGVNRVVAGDGPLRHLLPDALGFVSPKELRDLYRRAAVVMMASRDEGLPNVMLEAMAHARAMVATPVGGVPDMIEDGVTGLLVPVNDPTALRIAVERLLANPGLRKRLGYAGRERVTAYCAWETVIDSTLLAYEEALTTS
jgi:glycosyltransferase involved in cell wall biosynthesis